MRRVLLLAVVLPILAACGGSEEPASAPTASAADPDTTTAPETTTEEAATTEETTTEEAAAEPRPEAPPGVPRYVAGYRRWVKLNDAPIPPRDADPHNGTKDVYASRERRNDGSFPYGTIVVKEATRPGADFVGLLAIMRKQRGADPEHNDWVFVEYTREAAGARYRLQARDAVCWSCHVGALDDDYVFTR
ncbi:MAG: cytochrome P460 family protein [Gaiellaceae bacterium]